MLNNKKKKKGFTLIELIIVIAIIAILAAIALPKFGEIRENANIKSDIANAKNIQSAVVALIGEGKIENGATFTLSSTATAGNEKDVLDYLQNVPTGKSASHKGTNYSVEVDRTGNVKIMLGTETVYPQPSEGTYKEK